MLVLTRQIDEIICIGLDVTVKVLGINGNKVRLGITAPKTVEVDRYEIRQRKLAESILLAAKNFEFKEQLP